VEEKKKRDGEVEGKRERNDCKRKKQDARKKMIKWRKKRVGVGGEK
jgi:hypothetical protein